MPNKILFPILLLCLSNISFAQSDNQYPYWTEKALKRGLGQSVDTPFYRATNAAANGDVKAQVALGTWYMDGVNGAPKNEKEGLRYFEMAAKNGSGDAYNNLGLAYVRGIGVTKNIPKAKEYFEKAMNVGNIEGNNNLAVMYSNGELGEKNLPKAIEILQPGIKAGNYTSAKINAQIQLMMKK